MLQKRRTVIMGAAGRDFHNFNTVYRENPSVNVVAFTATQIPDIDDRKYPPELAGEFYPNGIPIVDEEELLYLIERENIEDVVFSYSDITHEYVMHKASKVLSAGANFFLLGMGETALKSKKPVISICATRTGSGKSQTTRRISEILIRQGKRVVAVRHPMPYGDLAKQAVQRFASESDLDTHECTIEEREEYEPHIRRNVTVYAGVDYGKILEQAEEEADIILWDGGNNDLPFYQPNLHIVVADPHRVGNELTYHPGEANMHLADCIVINKVDTANYEDVLILRENIHSITPDVVIIEAASPLTVSDYETVRGKTVLVIEDGPTLTHGEMEYGAGMIAAWKNGAGEVIDPRPYTVGKITETFEKYPDIGPLVPAMGYSEEQVRDLEATINAVECDLVISGTPIDLEKLININKPLVKVEYDLQEIGRPTLEDVLKQYGF